MSIRVYDVTTMQRVRVFRGHSNRITDLVSGVKLKRLSSDWVSDFSIRDSHRTVVCFFPLRSIRICGCGICLPLAVSIGFASLPLPHPSQCRRLENSSRLRTSDRFVLLTPPSFLDLLYVALPAHLLYGRGFLFGRSANVFVSLFVHFEVLYLSAEPMMLNQSST